VARLLWTAACSALLVSLAAGPARAAFPGQNGKIAFQSNGEIVVMNADGSGQNNITNLPGSDREPAWSPDGTKIAFTSDRAPAGVFVMDAGGSGVTSRAVGGTQPAWSPDGMKIAFMRLVSGNQEIFVMNADGTGEVNISNNPAHDREPAWSPDGTKIAFTSERAPGGIFVMNANGAGPLNLEPGGLQAAWSPDGQKIAFQSGGEILVMNADGTGPTNITNDPNLDAEPAWSPDGTKIAFTTNRPSLGPSEVYVMNANGSGPTNLSNNGNLGAVDLEPDWQPLPAAPSACGNTTLQLNRATVEGTLAETGPGTGVFRAEAGQVVYVGGFELRPRFGGALVVDRGAGTLVEEGTGVQVLFGRFEVPLAVSSIPINLPEATFALNKDGTLLKTLLSLPISGQLKAAWADGGKSAGLELELEAEKLVGNFGSFSGAGVTTPSLKLQAKQVNCTGFDFTGAEVKADEISFIPTKLRVPKKLGLKNFLLKYEERNGVSFFTGQGELILPTGKGELAVGGKLTIADTTLAGVGVSASGINRHIGYGLFLQSVAGELAFQPDFGANFGVTATLGPQVQGKKLVKLGGNLKFLSLASECTNGRDPISLVATGSIPLVEELGAGSVKIEGVNCIYTDSLAIEQSPKVEAVFGDVVGGEIPRPVVAAKANLSGFIGETGINAEGGGTITIPVVGDVGGQALMSTRAFAACGRVGFFSGGASHVWGQSRTEAFSGCDLAPWRASAGAGSSPFASGLPSPLAFGANAVKVKGDAPFIGFSAQGANGPPQLRITGPKGERITSRKGRAVVRRDVVIVPVEAERRTFVFVKKPSAGRWRVDGVGQRLTQLRTAEGLPKPKVSGAVSGEGAKRTLSYTVRQITGQRITFFERTKDGVAKQIGRARRARGRIVFTPASTGQRARIEAAVTQNGLPRDTITIARFTATPPGAKAPARPRQLTAKRAGRGLAVSWSRVAGVARYRVDVLSGRRLVASRTTTRTRLRFARAPAGRLRVEVRALSREGVASAPRAVAIGAVRVR
jgi:hypothetical protein